MDAQKLKQPTTNFNEKYKGIAAWHKNLADEALRFLKITNISGRQYAFPDVTRRTMVHQHFTMIKNYPVQGFATGDVVPVVLNEMHERLRHMKSCLVNTVHDSMVVDVHPDEKDLVLSMVWTLNEGFKQNNRGDIWYRNECAYAFRSKNR